MQNEQLQKLDGLALSDYLRTLPATVHRETCEDIAGWVDLSTWCDLEEPFQTYVAWGIEGESGSYGNGRTFALEIVGQGVTLMQGFDRRNRRVKKTFEPGEVVVMRAGEARVTYKTYGPGSSMASDRGKVKEHKPDPVAVVTKKTRQKK